jgi:predicted regulator of Ras-like GTPase activity (Roadblock/LC7/MglB family)
MTNPIESPAVLREDQTILGADETLTTLESQIQAYCRQIQEAPDNRELLVQYAEANLAGGHPLEALRVFEKISQDSPDARLAIARIYLMQRRYEESYAEVSRMLTASPNLAGAHLLLKLLTRVADAPPQYVEAIRQVNGYLPPDEDVHPLRGKLLHERDQIAQDIEEFEQIRQEVDSQDPVMEYHVLCATQRKKFVEGALSILDTWERVRSERQEEHQEAERLRLEAEELERLRFEEAQQRADAEAREQRAAEAAAAAEAARKPTPPEAALGFYQQIAPNLSDIIGSLAKIRNVAAALVVTRTGYIVHQELKENVPEESLGEFVQEGVTFLDEHNPGKFSLWVLEFDKGILVVQSLHGQHVLLLMGASGANFGSLKFNIDKARPQLAALLQPTPVA